MKKLIVFSLIFFSLITLSANAKLLMQPYLQAVTDSSIIVMAETDNINKVEVLYGTDSSLNQKEFTFFTIKAVTNKPSYVQRILLKGLNDNTIYYYKVIHDKSISEIYHFKTAPRNEVGFRFAVLGDFRSNPEMFNIVTKEVAKRNPDMSVYLGDLCYNSEYATWKKEFFVKANLNLISNVPFFNAVGNHEGWKANTKAFQQSPSLTNNNSPYYSFDYGNIHFVVISTEHDIKKGSQQYDFIKKDIANSNKKWKIAVAHIPAYCSGGHGNNYDMIALTKEIFEPEKVDFVLAGHSHFYQHNLINGIRHMVFGGGGAPLNEPVKSSYTIIADKSYNYTIFDINGNSLKMTAYDIYGKIIDILELKK